LLIIASPYKNQLTIKGLFKDPKLAENLTIALPAKETPFKTLLANEPLVTLL